MKAKKEKNRYFREVRRLYADSMETMTEVRTVDDIVNIFERNKLTKGYYANIRIDPNTRRDHRDKDDDWGEDTYMVVADFEGFDGQCIGFCNFVE